MGTNDQVTYVDIAVNGVQVGGLGLENNTGISTIQVVFISNGEETKPKVISIFCIHLNFFE